MTEFALVDDECACPVCRSDLVDIVPCLTNEKQSNPVRVAPPTGSSHSLPVGTQSLSQPPKQPQTPTGAEAQSVRHLQGSADALLPIPPRDAAHVFFSPPCELLSSRTGGAA